MLGSTFHPHALRLVRLVELFGELGGLLAWSGGFLNPLSSQLETRRSEAFAAVRNLSDRGDLREAAANLFRYLRELDALGLDLIIAERVPSRGLGAAIMDRLERASHR